MKSILYILTILLVFTTCKQQAENVSVAESVPFLVVNPAIDKDSLIVAGYDNVEIPLGHYLLEIYDIKNKSCKSYILKKEYTKTESYGMYAMKEQRVIIH